jgi:uncharacterized protein DUF6166
MPTVKYVGIHKDPSTIGDLYEVVVEREGQKPYHLNPRLEIINHSPTGVCWGYCGSGPAQLALAILVDHFTDGDQRNYARPDYDTPADPDIERALSLYQDFKFAVIARLPMDQGFELTDQQVESAVTKLTIKRMQEA